MSKVTDFKPDDNNANQGTERGQYMLDNSIANYGAGRSIVVDKHNNIIAGNKTQQAAIDAGINDAIVVKSDGTKLVVVQRTDLDLYEDDTARLLAYADNRAGQLGLDWSPDALLKDVASGLDLSVMFGEDELTDIIKDADGYQEPESLDAEAQISRADELREEWGVELGQVWRLVSRDGKGEHRVICGDCTDRAVVDEVMGGDVAEMLLTDPPYGVNYNQEWRSSNRTGEVFNDNIFDWREAYANVSADIVYCWHACWHASSVQDGLEVTGYEIRAQIIWVKDRQVFSMGHYHWKHEPCWYGVMKGKTASWGGDRKQRTVWEFGLSADVDGSHGTQKPVPLFEQSIRNHKVKIIVDIFLGSGTTLIACENLNRYCRAVEISPAYVAVSLQRYKDAFGIEAELIQ